MGVEHVSLPLTLNSNTSHTFYGKAEWKRIKKCLQNMRSSFCSSRMKSLTSYPSHPWKCQGAFSHVYHHFILRKACGRDKTYCCPYFIVKESDVQWLNDFNKAMALVRMYPFSRKQLSSPAFWGRLSLPVAQIHLQLEWSSLQNPQEGHWCS